MQLEAKVLSSDGEVKLPEAGLQVRAIDRETGRVVSSIGETDENGDFAIRIGDTTSDYLIRVTSSAGGDPFPAVSVDPELVQTLAQANRSTFRASNPFSSAAEFATDDRPVAGATVRFLIDGHLWR